MKLYYEGIMTRAGCYTALITPFKGEGIDFEGLKKNIEEQIQNGIAGLVLLGTTGEAPTLESDDRLILIESVAEMIQKRVSLWVGVSSNSTKQSVLWARQAQNAGADAIMLSAPYYNKPTQDGIFSHYFEVGSRVEIPMLIYDIPGRCAVPIEMQTYEQILKACDVIGVKEATGCIHKLDKLLRLLESKNLSIPVFTGDDSMILPAIALGAKGCISVASNLIPKEMEEFIQLAINGNTEKARNMHRFLSPLFEILFIESNPTPVKAAMEFMGKAAGPCRLPLSPLREENENKLKKELESLGLLSCQAEVKTQI